MWMFFLSLLRISHWLKHSFKADSDFQIPISDPIQQDEEPDAETHTPLLAQIGPSSLGLDSECPLNLQGKKMC